MRSGRDEAMKMPAADLGRARIALYSHDTMGLGHMRRNLLIAKALAGSPLRPTILMIGGARELNSFALPPGVDCLTLPALRKSDAGRYGSRRLHLSLRELTGLRARTISAALEAFAPDVLVVDNVPRGAVRELDPALECLRARGHTRCVLGLRDVLDDPETVRREWAGAANEAALRQYYDAVWVYGDPAVYDLVREYRFAPDVAAKVTYTGYLDQRARLEAPDGQAPARRADADLPPGRFALCLVGGGQDGAALAEAFAAAELPHGMDGVLVSGPFMPPEVRERLARRTAGRRRLRVLEFVDEPTGLLRRADRVVAMGGYNTVWEALSFDKRTLIVPRVAPRREQLIRAERLHALGLLDVLHPDSLGSGALTEWLAREPQPVPRVRDRVDLDGLTRLPRLLEEMLRAPRYAAWSGHPPPGGLPTPDGLPTQKGALAHVAS